MEEYKKLQQDYARLNEEIESLKHVVAKTPSGEERQRAFDQIRLRESDFGALQKNEARSTSV